VLYSRCQITRPKKKRYRLRKIHNSSVLPNTNNDWEFKFLLHRFQTFSRLTITILIGFIIGKAYPSKCLLDRVNYCCYYETRIWFNKTTHLHRILNNSRCRLLLLILFSSWLNNHWWISNHRTTFDFHLLQLIIKLVPHSSPFMSSLFTEF
jgi:hypothetical protein